MNWDVFLGKRINYDAHIEIEDYLGGMRQVLSSLVNDFEKFLDQEGRYFGIIVQYLHDLRQHMGALPVTDPDISSKILFLFKPVILKAYRKYLKKGLTKADCTICILRSICSCILQVENNSDILAMYEILEKLFKNIKNPSKSYTSNLLESSLVECITDGLVGIYGLDSFSIIGEEQKRKDRAPIEGSGVRLNKSFDNEISEVSWTEE